MTPRMHVCPAPTCSTLVPASQFACLPDWRRMPAELREAILSTYRVRQRDKSQWRPHALAMAEASTWLRDHPIGEPQ